jgi:hypothetical protein
MNRNGYGTGSALILHIGHHRTGTTTLQESAFPQLKHIAYICKDSPASAQVTDAFAGSPAIWRQRGSEILDPVFARASEQRSGAALISHEGMSSHKIFAAPGATYQKTRLNHRRDPFLLAAHLRECRASAEKAGFDSVRVIMGIRRQDQYLASRYALMAPRMLAAPSQIDFAQQVLEIIDPHKRYFFDGIWLDYKKTRDLIADAVGEDNVLLLPLEQLSIEPSRYFSSLSAFLGEEVSSSAYKNRRSFAVDMWQFRLTTKKGTVWKRSFRKLRALLTGPVRIHLTPELKEKILAAYHDSNHSLARDLKLDLAQYGYCGAPDG